MANFQLQNDAVTTWPNCLSFTDQVGKPIAPPAGGTVSTSDATLGTATLEADGVSIVVAPLAAAGTFNVLYSGGGVTGSYGVDIVAPVAVAVAFNTANATFSAKP